MTISIDRSSRSDGDAALPNERVPGYLQAPAAGDPLGKALRAVRLTGALFFVIDATSPWCVDVPVARAYAHIILPRAPHVVSYHVCVEGSGWASLPNVAPVPFEAGDVILFPHGDPYVMQSTPGVPPELDAGQTLEFFRAVAAGELPFVIPEGGGEPPRAKFICGFLGCQARPFNPILSSLPRMLRLRRPQARSGDLLDRLIEMTLEETLARRAGGEGVRLRLSELLFIEVLRQYAAAPVPKPPGWLSGLEDPAIARALAAMSDRPGENWTVPALARVAGLSRSALAARFAARLGHSPIDYLTRWRMLVAASKLTEGTAPIAEIAAAVGYGSEAAFSRSFKRVAGVSPGTWRRGGAGAAPG